MQSSIDLRKNIALGTQEKKRILITSSVQYEFS